MRGSAPRGGPWRGNHLSPVAESQEITPVDHVVLLRVDEAQHRDDLLAALDAGLEQLQAQMFDDVLAAYDAATRDREDRATAVIAGEFRPARAGQ